MLSSLAAVLTLTTLSMFASSSFRKEFKVGENWFLEYRLSNILATLVNIRYGQQS